MVWCMYIYDFGRYVLTMCMYVLYISKFKSILHYYTISQYICYILCVVLIHCSLGHSGVSLSTDAFMVTLNDDEEHNEDVGMTTAGIESHQTTTDMSTVRGELHECLLTQTYTRSEDVNTVGSVDGVNDAYVCNAVDICRQHQLRSEDISDFTKSWSHKKLQDICINMDNEHSSSSSSSSSSNDRKRSIFDLNYYDNHPELNLVLKNIAIRLLRHLVHTTQKSSSRTGHHHHPHHPHHPQSQHRSACFTLPIGGLRCLSQLKTFSAPQALISIIADKGFTRYVRMYVCMYVCMYVYRIYIFLYCFVMHGNINKG